MENIEADKEILSAKNKKWEEDLVLARHETIVVFFYKLLEKEKARGMKRLRREVKEQESIFKKLEALKEPPNKQREQPFWVKAYFEAPMAASLFLNFKTLKRAPYEAPIEEDSKEYNLQFFEIVEDIIRSFESLNKSCDKLDIVVKNLQRTVQWCDRDR